MVTVKWIAQNEITLYADDVKELECVKAFSVRIYKHPRIGTRLSDIQLGLISFLIIQY